MPVDGCKLVITHNLHVQSSLMQALVHHHKSLPQTNWLCVIQMLKVTLTSTKEDGERTANSASETM